jgi:hypothetical protein
MSDDSGDSSLYPELQIKGSGGLTNFSRFKLSVLLLPWNNNKKSN